MKKRNLALSTFIAIVLVIGVILATAVPWITDTIETTYLDLQADVNARQADNVARFIQTRLDAGASPNQVSSEVQILIANSQADRGYTCSINRADGKFVNHPMQMAIGMDISTKKALFFSEPDNIPRQKWEDFVDRGQSARGELEYPGEDGRIAPGMDEVVAMVAVPGSTWTVSTHENISRLNSEIRSLQQTIVFVALMLGMAIAVGAAFVARRISGNYERIIEGEQEKSEGLLRNILPDDVARELKETGGTTPKRYENVSLLFSDLAGFTSLSTQLSPEKLVEVLNEIFLAFDRLAERYGVEKIKTIGDSYMAGAGIPHADPQHADKLARMSFDMLAALETVNQKFNLALKMRIGISSGAAVAGVIGKSKFAYDLWGDVVNLASRMESTAEPGRVHISEATRVLLNDSFTFEEREAVQVKGLGSMRTFFVHPPAG